MSNLYKLSLLLTIFCLVISCEKDDVKNYDEGVQRKVISGKILDFQNNPMGGIRVGVYLEKERLCGSEDRSEFILKAQAVTGIDGRYSLNIEREDDEYDTSYESEEGMVYEKNRYQVKVEEIQPESFYNRVILFSDNPDSFWDEGNRELDDFKLYRGKYLTLILNKMHPSARLNGCKISHGFEENQYFYPPEIVSNVPFQTSFLYPVGKDLFILRDWEDKLTDTLRFTYPEIPDVIDASYYSMTSSNIPYKE